MNSVVLEKIAAMSVKRKRTWWKVGIIKVIEGQDSRPILFADFATSLVVLFFASWHLLVGLLVREPFCWKNSQTTLPSPIWPNLAFDNSTLPILTNFYPLVTHNSSKSRIFCPKIQFWQNHNMFTSFPPKFFWQIFSWNQSCQQLKSPKPQHFHEFFTQKNRQFSQEIKVDFWTKNEDFEQCGFYKNLKRFNRFGDLGDISIQCHRIAQIHHSLRILFLTEFLGVGVENQTFWKSFKRMQNIQFISAGGNEGLQTLLFKVTFYIG